MIIDTHAHLDFDDFQDDRKEVIARADNADVKIIVNVGTDVATSAAAVRLAAEYASVYATVGIHPHEAKTYTHETMAEIDALLLQDKVVAIGEVGLDYYRDHSPRDMQRNMFADFLQLHARSALPLIIHARDSYDDVFAMIRSELKGNVTGVMHCFAGDEAVLEQALDLGLYISFAGQVTYKKNDVLRSCLRKVPDNRLLLETDCPFLAPEGYRGKRNEPAYLAAIVSCIADVRGVSNADVARYTTYNAQQLFRLPDSAQDALDVVYKIRNSLYINVTAACSSDCVFCPRFTDKIIKGYNLALKHEPSVEEVITTIEAYQGKYEEVCFCGLGEPLMRLQFVVDVAKALKARFPLLRLRLDTNGQGNLINKRNILPELQGLIDKVCVSLNAHTSEMYHAIVKPHFQGDVYQSVKEFIREAKKYIPDVEATCLTYPGVDAEAVRHIAQNELGVSFRLRIYDEVG